jgi:hypothetical protein
MSKKFLSRLLTVAFLFAGQSLHVACAADDDQDLARSILEKSDQILFPREGFQVDIKIDTAAPGQPPETPRYRVLSKGNENTVVMITEPATERGQIMLMKGRDLWIFSAAFRSRCGWRWRKRLTDRCPMVTSRGRTSPVILHAEDLAHRHHRRRTILLLELTAGLTAASP